MLQRQQEPGTTEMATENLVYYEAELFRKHCLVKDHPVV